MFRRAMLINKRMCISLLATSLFSSHVFAHDDYILGTRFFTITEASLRPHHFQDPSMLIQSALAFSSTQTSVSLMNWSIHESPPPRPMHAYDRAGQFGAWLVRNPNKNCLDTRALVLIRESKGPTTPWSVDPCYVGQGAWHDPYTSQNFIEAQKLQIDHVVALKNAYISGAFAWSAKARCAYANFLGSQYHLLAVEARTNTQKGDSTPARWLPPNGSFRCAYLSAWLRIKLTWQLMLSDDEARAIHQQVREFNCRPADFMMPTKELFEQRRLISKGVEECPSTPPKPRIPSKF